MCECCEGYGYHELEEDVECGKGTEVIDGTVDCVACKGSGFVESK